MAYEYKGLGFSDEDIQSVENSITNNQLTTTITLKDGSTTISSAAVNLPSRGSDVTLPLVNLQKIAEFPYSSTFTDEQANTLENQVASAIGFTYDDGIEYHVTCYLVKYDSLHNQYKWRYED